MELNQKTIQKKLIFEGIGLHLGEPVKLSLLPAAEDEGIEFVRTDLKKNSVIKANWKNIYSTNLCTKIKNAKGSDVSTVEHLMFSLYSLGITNLTIEINGPEVPIMDGSAKNFIEDILKVGLLLQKKNKQTLHILKPIKICEQNRFIKYESTSTNFLEIDFTINFKDQFIKKQRYVLKNAGKNYQEIFNCRTFCHQEDLEKIFAMGLAKGGSLDNAIVISGNKVLNQDGLRQKDEFVRHKILDCIGDLYLSSFFINGKITCNQGGHELTAGLLKEIFKNKKNYLIE
jgi:UDP-3-O-[3-hydroxymyristoyl] N-acetylglucosamine deacetylase